MLYPQLSGEPNFVLIGVSAVFGLLVIIMVYYIFISKNARGEINQYNAQQSGRNNNISSGTTGTTGTKANTVSLAPVPINTGGSYAPAPTGITTPKTNQVFNIKENIYTLDDAPAVCGALGADFASINQLIDAHRSGADWCNVGWTKDGLAAYPIQYSTWKTLQDNVPGKRDICGSPGINLVRNDPNLLYGVNCYGIKPDPKGNEKVKQIILSDTQIALNAKIKEFQKNINAIGVVPFNAGSWSV